MVSYDPRGMSWSQYSKLMAELFAQDQLGYVEEANWKHWVNNFVNNGNLAQSGIPDGRTFANWQDWAQAMVGILSIGVTQ